MLSAKIDMDLTILALRSHAHSVLSLIYLWVKRAQNVRNAEHPTGLICLEFDSVYCMKR